MSSLRSAPLLLARLPVISAALCALLVTGCTITPPARSRIGAPPAAAVSSAALDRYRVDVAQRIVERNPARVMRGAPQVMLRSLIVVAFTVDRNGRLVRSSVYRTNGDDEAEAIALATLRHASPLPAPPGRLLDARGHLELMEDWLFNDNGQFQLRTLSPPQAQSLD